MHLKIPKHVKKVREIHALKRSNMHNKHAKYAQSLEICTKSVKYVLKPLNMLLKRKTCIYKNMQNSNTAIHSEICLAVENFYTGVHISSATKNAFA